MTEYDLGCLFFHKVCILGCLLGSNGRDLLVKVGRHRQISGGTSASVAHTARCLPMTMTVQVLSTLSMSLVCPFAFVFLDSSSISLISC